MTALTAGQVGCPVLLPGQAPYEAAMAAIFFTDAARSRPSAIVQPRSADDVAQAVRTLAEAGETFTVRGGGLSRECARDGVVMLDLATFMNTARRDGDRVIAGGGTTMGTILDALDDIDRALPIGVYTIPGLGLATRGGVGYLTRGRGLTMDYIEQIELVVASGDVVTLSAGSSGSEADLWWAARGCAPHFGVVTSITFRTVPRPRVHVHRAVVAPETLENYLAVAPTCPRDLSVSAVVGFPAGQAGEPVLFLMAVHSESDSGAVEQTRKVIRDIAGGDPILWEAASSHRYMGDDMPEFGPPALPGGQAAQPLDSPSLFSKAPTTSSGLDAATAREVVRLARQAPSYASRIDFQHTGGELAAVPDEATSFWGRSAEWNNPVNALWSDPAAEASSRAWARDVVAAYSPHQVAIYSVELRAGLPETAEEVATAFGPNLSRLVEVKRIWDPDNVIREYFPLSAD